MRYIIVSFLFLICISEIACQGDQLIEKKYDCRIHFAGSQKNLTLYHIHKDSKYLDTALLMVNKAIDSCYSKDFVSIQLKLGILVLQKDYKNGIEYLNTIDESVFERNYEKKMCEDMFNFLGCNSKNDSLTGVSHLKNSISRIDKYISSHPEDKKAVMDYYNVKSIFESPNEIEKEINQKIESNPAEKDFYEALKGSFATSQVHDYFFHSKE